MEFDEVQTIWGAQDDQAQYKIDEKELHSRILARKNKAVFTTNLSELVLICVYLGTGAFIFWLNGNSGTRKFSLDLMAGWVVLVALVVIVSRIWRIISDRRFDRSIQGELQHALAVATYQTRLSMFMRWNMFMMCGLILFGMLEGRKPWWATAGTLFFALLVYYGGRFEHQKYKRQKERLEELKQQLEG